MAKTFLTENSRKYKLFTAWIGYLTDIHNNIITDDFDELIEGTATISKLTKNEIALRMDDSRVIYTIPIVPKIEKHSLPSDVLFVVIGRKDSKWWPVDVISIGSIVNETQGEVHLTVNPLYMDLIRTPQSAVH